MKPPDGWRTPMLVATCAFSAGVQLAAVLQVLGGRGYFDDGALLKVFTVVALPWSLWALLPGDRRRAPALAPMREAPAPRSAPRAAALRLSLETPLARAPVWPPGEPLPVTVQVGPEPVPDLDIELHLRHAGGNERLRVPLRGSAVVLSQTVPVPGPFALTARALLDGAGVAEATVEGRASTYREEVGRRFDALKARASEAGLPVGTDATPREVTDALARRDPRARRSLEELTAALQVALYSEEDVGRDAYEALARAMAEAERGLAEVAARA